jgi:UPF0755 protein
MRLVAGLVAFVLLLAAIVGGYAYHTYQKAHRPFKGYAEEEIFYTIPSGASSSSVAQALATQSIVLEEQLFLQALWLREAGGRLQAGEYRFAEPISTFEVIERLVKGDVYYLSVTIPEGLTVSETASLLADKGLGEAEAFQTAFSKVDLIASLDSEATDLEGYLFPETYRLSRRPAPAEVARAAISRFKQVFDETRRQKAEELELSIREVVTLASIVEKETGQAEERPLIGSVFSNRLRLGIPLQSDPTIIYELKIRGTYDGNLRRSDLELESPYNTYRVRGIPPGPIASPGRDAIDAVLYPPETKYLYFVSKNDGSHHFSRTLREHSAAVRKYQIEYFRNQRRRRK